MEILVFQQKTSNTFSQIRYNYTTMNTENNKNTFETRLDRDFLPFVRQPGRYIGGEANQIKKDLSNIDMKVALAFPDTYEIGMSNTGIMVIYNIINMFEWAAAERVFTPWIDAIEVMRDKDIPLYSLESKLPISEFDILGFSITTELCHTNILEMIDLSGLPVRSSDRNDEMPLIIAGGQVSNCAEPLADFIDLFIIGEGEETTPMLLELYREFKNDGKTKKEFLHEAARRFNWAYVPSLYKFEYDGEIIRSFMPLKSDIPRRLENAVVKDFDKSPVPFKPIIPFVEAVHERIAIEIMRGCPGRCRFCQASFSRRPIRFRKPETILEIAKQNYHATGFDTISLLSLSTADYPWLEELIKILNEYFIPRHVGISLPSLRVDTTLKLIPQLATSVRKSGLTIAVEASSERLRKLINKPLSNENLFAAIEAAYRAGFERVKLYFMAGFPGETEEDVKEIVDLAWDIANLSKKVNGKRASVSAAISWLIPKPHTPFQWIGQRELEWFEKVKKIVIDRKFELNAKAVQFKFHGLRRSTIEAAFARGDRRMCNVIEHAWKNGAKFDLWSEAFDYGIWERAFKANNMDIQRAAQISYDDEDILPWQHLGGPDIEYLRKHYKDSMNQ